MKVLAVLLLVCASIVIASATRIQLKNRFQSKTLSSSSSSSFSSSSSEVELNNELNMEDKLVTELEVSALDCATTGGTCFDLEQEQCNDGKVKIGMCPGPYNVVCCVGGKPGPIQHAVTPAAPSNVAVSSADRIEDSQCVSQGGRCLDIHDHSCSTGFVKGLCPGASFIQCCKSRQNQSIPPQYQNNGSVPSNARPTFNQLVACFPQGEAADVKKRIGGYVDASWISNTCAIRMSHTLNCLKNPKTKVPYVSGQSVTGKSGDNYIFRVKQLYPRVEKMFGKAQKFVAPTGRGVSLSTFTKEKGIIYFDTEGAWNDASGHFDLWDGKMMVGKGHANQATTERYFKLSRTIYFWKF